jgi:hypothetical protein
MTNAFITIQMCIINNIEVGRNVAMFIHVSRGWHSNNRLDHIVKIQVRIFSLEEMRDH